MLILSEPRLWERDGISELSWLPDGRILYRIPGNYPYVLVLPQVETERYRQHVLATTGKDLDDHGRALLEEDLRSPCTEEIAVFQAFSRIVAEADAKFVVMDTAPTGHTLLLLDATGAYHREVTRQMGETGAHLNTPMTCLQDPKQTKVLIVTLAETTPVLEAAYLQTDLRRAGRRVIRTTPQTVLLDGKWAWIAAGIQTSGSPRMKR